MDMAAKTPTLLPQSALALRVADIVVQVLAEAGVRMFFGIPGGAISAVYDALVDRDDLRVINTRHETGAAFMAMGYARSGGGLPAVLMTSGPGITNVITGLAAAHADGIPLIAIGGEVPRANFGKGALQEGSRYHLDILGMVRSVTKFSCEITTARGAATLVRKAVQTALSGRQGPVFISLPLDIACERVVPTATSTRVSTYFDFDEATLDAAATALQEAEHGMILVGSGCRSPEAASMLGAVASSLQMPVATTPKAKGVFPESDPLSLGIFGYGGHRTATAYLDEGVDVLLCVGAGLGETGTNGWSELLQPKKHFIQIDIDSAQIGKNYRVDTGLVGPAAVVLQKLLPRIRRRRSPVSPLADGPRHHNAEHMLEDTVPLKPTRAVTALQDLLPSDTIYTCDIGEHLLYVLHYLQIDRPDAFIVGTGLGSMGSGVGAAIGAKVAHPNRPVVSMCGDYGFQMFLGELATCVQDRIGVVFAVFNDARMRMVENGIEKIYGRHGRMDAPRMDFAGVAVAAGALGFRIESVADLNQLDLALFRGNRPVVLDIAIDPKAAFSVSNRVANLKNFTVIE
jgi:acetolactate synthase-1/2/3 large subunit